LEQETGTELAVISGPAEVIISGRIQVIADNPGDILCRFAATGWSGGVPDDCAGGAPGIVITPWLRVTGGPAVFYVCQAADLGYSRVKYTIAEL
jgi:hypothetical protein